MARVGRGISNGPNSRPLDASLAGSAPGIPDDALAPGEALDDVVAEDDDLSPEALRKTVFGEDLKR